MTCIGKYRHIKMNLITEHQVSITTRVIKKGKITSQGNLLTWCHTNL